jgi:hypothetical protein
VRHDSNVRTSRCCVVANLSRPLDRDRLVTSLLIVRGTMVLATVAWAVGEALMRRSPASDRLARAIWTMGIALAAIHVVLAFHWVYGWNHEAAVQATAGQTAARFGSGWRGGIYVNYVFLAWWLADVCWWWLAPASHASRPVRIEMARRALFTFMFVNGAVIFASGIGRLAGLASVALVLLAWVVRTPQKPCSA